MSRWGDRLKKVELLAQSFHQAPVAVPYKPRLWPLQPSSIWKLFPRQSLAINFANSCKEDVHVFALEKEQAVGQRTYLVTSYIELWHYYKTYRQSLMHCYEVIPEGAVCKLYFDLEFHQPSNRGRDGKAMVASLIQFLCEKLKEEYGILCTEKDVLNLDSSTEEKFSRHLIFQLPNAAFKDNIHAGQFIHAILQPLLSTQNKVKEFQIDAEDVAADSVNNGSSCIVPVEQSPEEGGGRSPQAKRRKQEAGDHSFLVVQNKEGQDCSFVDLGVYSKNRNFRLYKSSKVGKNAAFTVADDNKFVGKPGKNVSVEECLFLSSLISNVSFTGQRILRWDTMDKKDSKNATLSAQQSTLNTSDCLGGYQCSPHQDVDNFVLTIVKKDGIQGAIRRWNYFVSEHLLVFDILKYRWCQNVGRFHKSNNIMIIVDLKEEVWYQKCHDPACKNFRSLSYPLPQDICVSYLMTMDEEDQAYLMDEVGNIEPSQTGSPGTPQAPVTQAGEPNVCGHCPDDLAYMEAVEDFERSQELAEDVSDQLLLQSMAEFDSKTYV